jgi:hypothetical protein
MPAPADDLIPSGKTLEELPELAGQQIDRSGDGD